MLLNFVFGQDTLMTEHKTYKTLRYYTFGTQAYGGCDEECEKEISKKYGFVNREKSGGMVKSRQKKRWDKHNKKVEEKLNIRHGPNWRDKYYAEISQCCGK